MTKKDQQIDMNKLSSMDDFVVWFLTYQDKNGRYYNFNSIYDIKSPEKQILDFCDYRNYQTMSKQNRFLKFKCLLFNKSRRKSNKRSKYI